MRAVPDRSRSKNTRHLPTRTMQTCTIYKTRHVTFSQFSVASQREQDPHHDVAVESPQVRPNRRLPNEFQSPNSRSTSSCAMPADGCARASSMRANIPSSTGACWEVRNSRNRLTAEISESGKRSIRSCSCSRSAVSPSFANSDAHARTIQRWKTRAYRYRREHGRRDISPCRDNDQLR
jgi:hypothetical protein